MNSAGLPLLLITLLAGFVAGLALMIGLASTNRRMIYVTLRGSAAWALAYGALLVAASLSSEDQLLGHGQRKAFCGFYLDCHLGATVLHTDRLDRILLQDSLITTSDDFILVDLRIDNDAKRATLTPNGLTAEIFDENNIRYRRRPDVEFEINRSLSNLPLLEVGISANQDVRRILVFEVPKETERLRVRVSKGNPIERFLELFLIGDEDSLLHGRSYFRV